MPDMNLDKILEGTYKQTSDKVYSTPTGGISNIYYKSCDHELKRQLNQWLASEIVKELELLVDTVGRKYILTDLEKEIEDRITFWKGKI